MRAEHAEHELQLAEPGTPARVALSVVIPLYNEREVLPLLYERLTDVLKPLAIRYELVLVDDGSRDNSGLYLLELAASHPEVKAVRLSRNFGKEAALTAGLDLSVGEAVVVLDADLRTRPSSLHKCWPRSMPALTSSA